jgi:hypothetical protein
MGEKEVMAHGERSLPVCDPGCEHPVPVPEHRRHPGLVLCYPVGGALTEGAGHETCVAGKRIHGMPGGPSSLVLQRLGQIPVIQRDERGDPPGVETGDETAIEVEPGLIDPPVAIGDDPWPGDREPIRGDAQLCQ